jgi:hypothetical protein
VKESSDDQGNDNVNALLMSGSMAPVAVSEPATLIFAGAGLIGLTGCGRGKKSHSSGKE